MTLTVVTLASMTPRARCAHGRKGRQDCRAAQRMRAENDGVPTSGEAWMRDATSDDERR
jgi:hypothetical protein